MKGKASDLAVHKHILDYGCSHHNEAHFNNKECGFALLSMGSTENVSDVFRTDLGR